LNNISVVGGCCAGIGFNLFNICVTVQRALGEEENL
jgi:hypothetical protein